MSTMSCQAFKILGQFDSLREYDVRVTLRTRGDFQIKRTGVLVVPIRSLKGFWYLLGCSTLKISTVEAFAVPFRVLSRKKYDRT